MARRRHSNNYNGGNAADPFSIIIEAIVMLIAAIITILSKPGEDEDNPT